MSPNKIIATFLTNEDLLAQFRASDGVSERALELLAEIEERGLPYVLDDDRQGSVPL